MRKRLIGFTALLALLFTLVHATALANSWGLNGCLLSIVEIGHTWDGYSAACQVRGTTAGGVTYHAAVMESRYHSVLLVATKDGSRCALLQRGDTAVYQPGQVSQFPKMEKTHRGFTLSYGTESYTYEEVGGRFYLTLADFNNYRLILREDGTQETADGGQTLFDRYSLGDADGMYLLDGDSDLESVNISLLPRSRAELLHLNRTRGLIADWNRLSEKEYAVYHAGKKGGKTVPVYSAPSTNAWRAAKGKAAMSLAGDWYSLDGSREWMAVLYQVSNRTSRIGYVQCKLLGNAFGASYNPSYNTSHIAGVTIANTYMTDDPLVSQFQQAESPKGTSVTLLSYYGNYAQAEITLEGKTAWGFIPLRDVDVTLPDIDHAKMAEADGFWRFDAGGSTGPGDYLRLYADGTYVANGLKDDTAFSDNRSTGTWAIYPAPDWNRFWSKPEWIMVLENETGYALCRGLHLTDTELSLTSDEGSGGYVRVTEAEFRSNISEDNG